MTYPDPTLEQLEFFRRRGWLVVADAIPQPDLNEIETRCERII